MDSPPVHLNNAPPPPPQATSPCRVRLMVSYGGRIQPRRYDNRRLSYVGGETKILSLDRSARFPALLSKLASITAFVSPLCLKYQLPGEDLDALVSVTDDDDIDHLMAEYDLLHRTSSTKPSPRLRLFLFPVGPPPPRPSAALLDAARSERQWFLDALNAVPAPPSAPPALPITLDASQSPDFLFGLDQDYLTTAAGKVTADPQSLSSVLENLPLEAPTKPDLVKDESEKPIAGGADSVAASPAVVSTGEIQRQSPDLDKPKIADNPPPVVPCNGSEENLPRVNLPEYGVRRAPEVIAAPPPSTAVYWLEQRGGASVGRYALSAPVGDQTVYLIQASPGGYPAIYTAAPRAVPAKAFCEATAPGLVSTKLVGGCGKLMTRLEAYAAATAGQVAYDRTERVVYDPSVAPTYQTVTSPRSRRCGR
ncbi:uncharacterized protein LOC103992650 [Musa acuminata AAA Group]|uniref:uncharacterized protein LOC103992650 n=1 Tax=Musa acuminata AAA Group TaxID=214697 RepID=UPI0031E19D18